MTTVELSVRGTHCASCATLIEEVLAERPGMVRAAVDLAAARASVTDDETRTGIEDLQAAIAGLGYGSSPAGGGETLPTR